MKIKRYKDWATYQYKDAVIAVMDEEDRWIIRVSDKYGFRWFDTTIKDNKFLKMKKAYDIQQEIINNPVTKYDFVDFINLN